MFVMRRKGSQGLGLGRRCLLTEEESESRDGSCSLTVWRMVFQDPIWEAQREGSEGPTSLSWDAMSAQAQRNFLSMPSSKDFCGGCRVRCQGPRVKSWGAAFLKHLPSHGG